MMYSYLPHAGKKQTCLDDILASRVRQAVGQQAALPRTGIHHFFSIREEITLGIPCSRCLRQFFALFQALAAPPGP
jgi:hypothetical protein